ncbi:WAP four-disulfide core domain protein 2 [Sorex araneus]|uniref:WAP four-disulfide core domain protein 2 n=1 Tax=Sorex araneus TaxID=42254 RepID=UPI002433D294|nr:WAP four-disulfide core domain protein 2 [Sorex araneus]
MPARSLGPPGGPLRGLLLGLLLLGLAAAASTSTSTSASTSTSTSASTSTAAPGVEKAGVCPPLEASSNCTQECRSDGDCADNLKCCRAGCASVCHLPNEKPGSCPQVDSGIPQLGVCVDQCQADSQCAGQMKCCRNGCGNVSCVTPV